MNLVQLVEGKRVVFITTKNIDYIRNTQEIRIMKQVAESVEVISSPKKNYALRILHVWGKVLFGHFRQDVVFVGFSPQLIVPFFRGKFKRQTLVIDFFISVYDTMVCDRKRFKKGGLLAGFCHRLDRNTLKGVDHVITDTAAHGRYFVEEFGGNPDIFETLYLEADAEIYYPRAQSKPEEYGNRFVVLYFGSILPLQGVEVILEAVDKLRDRKDICFEIIGPIPSAYHKPDGDNVRYYDWLSQEDLATHIAGADLCLAGHFNGEIGKARRTIPGKAYIYEMMEKPMILGENAATHELFHEDDRHYFVPMSDSDALARQIEEICGGLAGADDREYGK